MTANRRPKLFVGSSAEDLNIARALQENFEHDKWDTMVWDQNMFELSKPVMESLKSALAESDFGVFVFTPADVHRMRDQENSVPRDNVILEFGMFSGRLGTERCFMLQPRRTSMRLPTDLLGLTAATYDPRRSDNPTAMLGTA